MIDGGHGAVTIPAWALQLALYVGVGTNLFVFGSIVVGRLFTFRGSIVNGCWRSDHLSCRSLGNAIDLRSRSCAWKVNVWTGIAGILYDETLACAMN